MARVLSLAARRAVNAQETGEVFLILMTITHPSMAVPIRLVRDTNDIISQGQHYVALPFDVVLPADADDEAPQAQVTIDNISREITEAVEQLSDSPDITMSVILASTPDVIEMGPLPFIIGNFDTNATAITGTLTYEPILAEQFPADTYIPSTFPGLFGGALAA